METAWWHGTAYHHGAIDLFAGSGAPRLLAGGLECVLGRAFIATLSTGTGGDVANQLDAQAKATALTAALVKAVGATTEAPALAVLAPVFHFIDSNLHLSFSRAELAAQAGLGASRFHALFLTATGTAPMTWVRKRRLARAADLLVGTSLGMAAIAERVGLCDAYHLNKRFRTAYGLPPTAFRRQATG